MNNYNKTKKEENLNPEYQTLISTKINSNTF